MNDPKRTKLMAMVKCPHCGEEHSIRFNDTLEKGWNVLYCRKNWQDYIDDPPGYGKEFAVYCELSATRVLKMEESI